MWKVDSSVRLEIAQPPPFLLNWTSLTSSYLALSVLCVFAGRPATLHKENESFLYNPVIVPAMTSENKNHPHNQKYVRHTHSHTHSCNSWRCLFSSRSHCCLMLKKLVKTL